MKRPSWSILTTPGRYVPSARTDLKKTFARINREIDQARKIAAREAAISKPANVTPIAKKGKQK